MRESSPSVLAEGLTVTRGGARALSDVSLCVGAGAVTGLLGPSGCGKSTLMRSIVGVQQGVSGRVQVLGAPAGDARLRGRVAYLTQAPSVYGDLTVLENLRYFASLLGADRDAVRVALERVELSAMAGRLVGRLSGGERARVSLASALLGAPELLVLDEPTVGLDPLLRRRLWNLFRELAREGAAVLVSSHVMDEAHRCDRLLLMREGTLLADETPAELAQRTGTEDMDDAFVQVIEQAARR